MDGFFEKLWKFNAVIIAIAGLCAIAVGAATAALIVWELTRPGAAVQVMRADAGASAAETRRPTTRLAAPRPLGRTGLVALPVTTEYALRPSAATPTVSTYGKRSAVTLDWLIYDAANRRGRFLLNRRDALLVGATMLRTARPDQETGQETGRDPRPDLALLIRVIETDGDGDGLLSLRDPERFALANPDGTEVTMLPLSGAFLGVQVVDDDAAVLFIQTKDGPRAAHLRLRRKSIEALGVMPPAPVQATAP